MTKANHKRTDHDERATKSPRNDFFVVNKKPQVQTVTPDVRMRLGGVPLEKKAGLELIGLRLKQLLRGQSDAWEDINREEHGSFWSLFRKYHLPLLMPFYFFFIVREAIRFVNFKLFLRHTLILLPIFTLAYAGYIFVLGVLAEETAEVSGGRFSPQSGLRIAIFSSLILSFMSVAALLPVVGMPLLILALFWHYSQLFNGARTLLNINDGAFTVYRLSHLIVWALLGLTAFVILSVVSFISTKLGIVAI